MQSNDWFRREPTFTVVHRNGVSWSPPVASGNGMAWDDAVVRK